MVPTLGGGGGALFSGKTRNNKRPTSQTSDMFVQSKRKPLLKKEGQLGEIYQHFKIFPVSLVRKQEDKVKHHNSAR